MTSIDSLSEIVLGNVKVPAEDEKHIVPFLQRIKKTFGIPLALVHDMGKGILKAVGEVFPGVPDFICHFHFLRDIGKDFFGAEYDTIRKRLSKHGIRAKLLYRAKRLKRTMDANPGLMESLGTGLQGVPPSASEAHRLLPVLNAYTLIQWTLSSKGESDGYGFPFDCAHLAFTKRIASLSEYLERIKDIDRPGMWMNNLPYARLQVALRPIIKDRTLWKAVKTIEGKVIVFEKLRAAMRIAAKSGKGGLNDRGGSTNMRSIEKGVEKFRAWLSRSKNYSHNPEARKMIEQIDKYREKLFADAIVVKTPTGSILIQPQRTNNILEQFFRSLKHANRRKTGNASSCRMLRSMLAETPLVRNLENHAYMNILLNGKTSLEEVFAEIEIDTLREAFRQAQETPEKIPSKLKPLIALPNFPEKLVNTLRGAA